MKILKLIACSFVLISASSFAQFDMGNVDVTEAFKTEIAAHDLSPVIQGVISDVETKYVVTCDGYTTPDYPYLQARLTYRATCLGEAKKIKLIIKSKYASTKDGLIFTIKKASIKFK